MARLSPSDARGAVYVEFLLAFMPIFLLFLGICQLALVSVAKVVVAHAAVTAARAAIVVLEDDPQNYGNAPRGVVRQGHGQPGPRLQAILAAALAPLRILAPGDAALSVPGQSIGSALTPMTVARSLASDAYTRFATRVSLHDSVQGDALAGEPIVFDGLVTARVVYYFQCDIPLARALVCRSAQSLEADPTSPFRRMLSQIPPSESALVQSLSRARFFELRAQATLPNQGAAYEHAEGSG